LLPSKAKVDALHIATATIGGMNYLLTWNCAHIANPKAEALDSKQWVSWNPKLKLWTPNNGYLGIQSFSFGSILESKALNFIRWMTAYLLSTLLTVNTLNFDEKISYHRSFG
jgi:hypothetical protein